MPKPTSLVLTRVLPASCERVFAMWTDPAELKRWFAPGAMTVPEAEVDPRPGGTYRIVMQNKEGETYSPSGTYEEIVPNEKLIFTWKWADSELVTRVTVVLRALAPDKTELTLTHEGFVDAAMCDRHTEGWVGCLSNLESTL